MFVRSIEIPSQFHSLYFEGPFRNCIDCNRDLLSGECLYFIDRAFNAQEPVFELAICEDCRNKIAAELSKESMMRTTAFIEERLDFETRYEMTGQWHESEVHRWLDHCALLKTPIADCREYQFGAVCQGDRMSLDVFPLMISGDAAAEMQKLMSKQTRDRLGDMLQDFFGMPSEFVDSPTHSPLFL